MVNARPAALARAVPVALLAAVTMAIALGDAAPGAPAQRQAAKQVIGFIGGAAGGAGGSFREPSDVALYRGDTMDPGDDKIFVSEAAPGRNGRVQRLDGHGNFELMWGRDVVRAGFRGDTGTSFEVCRRTVSGDGGCKTAPPGGGAGELDMPIALAVSEATGHVYVMDQGNRRVQQFDGDGRLIRAWGRFGVSPGGLLGTPSSGIAVDPRPPHDVFVGDVGNRRVMQFSADGAFVRGWGWGVATGGAGFEVCAPEGGCMRGRARGRPAGVTASGWPRHLAVGRDGIVYSAALAHNDALIRFASDPPPDGSDASEALLAPLSVGPALSDGETLGMDLDPVSGRLVVARNPFGPAVVDEVANPGAPLDAGDGAAPRAMVGDALGYVRSVHGLGVREGGAIYVPVSHGLDPRDPSSSFGGCPAAGGPRPCQGLAVLGRSRTRWAALTGATRASGSSATVAAAIEPVGAARYRLQVTSDGRRWRDAGEPRYAGGPSALLATLSAGSLKPGVAYRARVRIGTTTDGGSYHWTTSNEWVVAPRGVAR